MAEIMECWICYEFAALTLKAVLRHIGAAHSLDPNFRVTCGINHCTRVYIPHLEVMCIVSTRTS